MTDLYFTGTELSKHIHAHTLVAFYPDKGFAIFEGYSRIKHEDLPYKVAVCRSITNTHCMLFDIEITNFHKKDIQEPPRKIQPGHEDCDPCECDCRIRFFSKDFIILEFKTITVNKELRQMTEDEIRQSTFCEDNRFKTPEEMLKRYKTLVELPLDPYESYEICEEDAPFYEEYHKIMKHST